MVLSSQLRSKWVKRCRAPQPMGNRFHSSYSSIPVPLAWSKFHSSYDSIPVTLTWDRFHSLYNSIPLPLTCYWQHILPDKLSTLDSIYACVHCHMQRQFEWLDGHHTGMHQWWAYQKVSTERALDKVSAAWLAPVQHCNVDQNLENDASACAGALSGRVLCPASVSLQPLTSWCM